MKLRALALTGFLLFALSSPALHAAEELNFWHSYVHTQTGVTHYSFHLINYKRGLFFGSCGFSTRSLRWSYDFDLSGEGATYGAGQVTLSSDQPQAIRITGGSVTINPKRQTAVIALQVEEAGVTKDFVGNGTYPIHALK